MKRLAIMILVSGSFLYAQWAQADWSPAKRLTWTSDASASPVIAIDSAHTIHLVWQEYMCGSYEICHKLSKDGGATWSPTKRLSWNSGWSGSAALAIDTSDILHVVWEDTTPGKSDIYYKKSTDGGSTWSPAKRLTWNSGWSSMPAIATDSDGHVHVFWHDDTPGNSEIYYRRSSDGGSTWSAVKRLTWTLDYSGALAVAINSNNHIHIVWHESTGGDAEIYYRKSTDGGAAWGAVKRLTWSSGFSLAPAIAIDSGKTIHVVWDDDRPGNSEIYYRKSSDGGATWSAAKRLTWTSDTSSFSVLAIDSSNALHVIWRDHTPGNYELYHRRGAAGGATWDIPQRLTWNSGSSMNPAMAIDSGGTIHVVWDDDTPGNYEIYYKNGK
jgi:hypothetical protein